MTSTEKEYISRIHRVLDYIDRNIDKDLTLETLSNIACFSPFHFHRIFSSFVGETLNSFIKRLRIEKAANILLSNPDESIVNIALMCGFSGQAVFSRVFKEKFNMSAKDFRKKYITEKSKNNQIKSKNHQEKDILLLYNENHNKSKIKHTIEIKNAPELYVAYTRHIGDYRNIENNFKYILKWAEVRDLLNSDDTKVLTVYHDNPKITSSDRLRASACITIPEGTETKGEICSMRIPGGKFAIAHFEINKNQFGEAWDIICRDWLSESGYIPDDRFCYEVYNNYQNEHPEKKFIIDIYLPIRPL
jgi:AraC family transcriptional regulator